MRQAEARGNTPTLAEVVHRAVEVADPEGAEEGPSDLLRRFEDRDEPVTAEADVEQEIAEVKGAIDPQDEDPVVVMTAAVATYLAFRRTELEGKPPEHVARWLADQGVEV